MLTPCAVSAFASVIGEMTFIRRDGGKWVTDYRFDFTDLLIAEEAGQVLPEVAGASFAFPKRALLLGDTQQIGSFTSSRRPAA